jgi:hypothetical protein
MVVMQEAGAFARFFAMLSKSRIGIDVAHFQVAFGSWVQDFWDSIKKEISTCCGQFW